MQDLPFPRSVAADGSGVHLVETFPLVGLPEAGSTERVRQRLERQSGVSQVAVDRCRACITVHFDPQRMDPDQLRRALDEAAAVEFSAGGVAPPPQSSRAYGGSWACLAAAGAAAGVLGFFVLMNVLITSWEAARSQLLDHAGWLLALALSFGLEIGTFCALQGFLGFCERLVARAVLLVSGAISAFALLICCTPNLGRLLEDAGSDTPSSSWGGSFALGPVVLVAAITLNVIGAAAIRRLPRVMRRVPRSSGPSVRVSENPGLPGLPARQKIS